MHSVYIYGLLKCYNIFSASSSLLRVLLLLLRMYACDTLVCIVHLHKYAMRRPRAQREAQREHSKIHHRHATSREGAEEQRSRGHGRMG